MKPFVYIFASSLAIFALSGCGRPSEAPGNMAEAGESPAASLTAEEAAAYASYSPVMSLESSSAASEAASQ